MIAELTESTVEIKYDFILQVVAFAATVTESQAYFTQDVVEATRKQTLYLPAAA
jgi:hypothetical protein